MLLDTIKNSADSLVISAAGITVQMVDVPVAMKWVCAIIPLGYVIWRWVSAILDRRERQKWYHEHPNGTTPPIDPANPHGLDNSQN